MVRHRLNMIELLVICCLDFPELWAQFVFSSPKHPQSTDCSRLVQPARALVLLQIQRVVPTHSRGQGEGGPYHVSDGTVKAVKDFATPIPMDQQHAYA